MHEANQLKRSFAEIRLDETEKRLEMASFLGVFPSAFFMIFGFIPLIVVLTTLSRRFEAGIAAMLVIGSLLMCSLFVLWARAVARLSPITLFLATTVFALIPTWQTLHIFETVTDGEVLGADEKTILLLPFLLLPWFALQLFLDGWRLARTPKDTRKLFTTVVSGAGAFRQLMLRTLGIHQLTQWIPQLARRSTARAFYVLRSLSLGLAVFIIVSILSSSDRYMMFAAGPLCMYNSFRGRVYDPTGPGNPCVMAYAAWIGFPIIVCVLFGIGALLLFAARRVTRVSLEDLTAVDKRHPVLFLRSFKDDQVGLARPRRPFFRWLFGLGEPRPKLDHVLVEEGTPRGPVVAIGLPGSRPPFGSARTYVSGDEWQMVATDLARAASVIAIVADDTEGVLWELSMIRRERLVEKTIYLLPPRLSTPQEAKRIICREVVRDSAHGFGAEELPEKFGRLQRACIGWLQSSNGELTVFTTTRPSRTSYVSAVRIALAGRDGVADAHSAFPGRP